MMTRKMTMTGVLIALGIAALVAFSPNAAAQQEVTIQLNCDNGPDEIRPLSSPGKWSCTADPKVNTGSLSDPATFISIDLSPENEESWMNTIIAPTSLVFEWNENQDGYDTEEFNVEVALTQNAPAFESTRLTIGGSVGSEGVDARNVQIQPTDITVTPSYFNLYNVRLDTKIGQGGPQDSVDYNIQIDNFSNGDTRFDFRLVSEESIPDGFQPVLPDPVTVRSEATGGEQTTEQVQFSVYTPYRNGYVNEVGSIQLLITSAYASDTSYEGVDSSISTLTQARGFYVPGPGAAMAGLAIVAASVGLAGADVVRKD